MECIARFETLTAQRPFDLSAAPSQTKRLIAGITMPAKLFLIQAACYFAEVKFARVDGAGDAIPLVALLASIYGIYLGVRLSSEGSTARGLNCAAVNMVGLLFWILQIVVKHAPLP